jgi:nucleoside-diphosphate-sugar epimerase
MHINISILGCGWLGTLFGKRMISKGHHVKGSTTTPARIFELAEAEIQPFYLKIEPGVVRMGSDDFFYTDVLVISLPPGRDKSAETTFPKIIAEIIKLVRQYKIPRVLFVSSTSVYESVSATVREGEEGNPEKPSGRALLKAEKLLLSDGNFQTTVVRFGGLIGPGRNPGRFFAGGMNIPGNVPVNLIHSTDCVNILSQIIEKKVWGEVFNACCPEHPAREEFYLMASVISGLPVPHFSNETEAFKIINSDKLQENLNYTFVYRSPMDFLIELKEEF